MLGPGLGTEKLFAAAGAANLLEYLDTMYKKDAFVEPTTHTGKWRCTGKERRILWKSI